MRNNMKQAYNTASPDRYPLLKEMAARQKKFPTEAETRLWEELRCKHLGVKFNRQHVIGDYIADFVCLEKKLIVEMDGGYHDTPEQREADFRRSVELSRMGFEVIRFDNAEVMQDIESVLEKIMDELDDNN